MQSEPTQQTQYIYCYEKGATQSVVLLSSTETIIKGMLKLEEVIFVWLDPKLKINSERKEKIQYLEFVLDIKIEGYQSLADVEVFISKSQQDVMLICSEECLKLVQQLNRKEKVQGIICYPAKEDFEPQMQDLEHPETQKYFIKITKQQKFIECLKQKRRKKYNYKDLPNFISLKDSAWNSNIVTRCIFSMINQEITPKTRGMIVDQLEKLFEEFGKNNELVKMHEEEIKQFISDLKQGQLSVEKALYWYTKQTPVYKLLNNLFRAFEHPFQLFYMQPFFHDIFKAVLKLSSKQQEEELLCYRGGFITEKQADYFFKNSGNVAQNLGFLSTSLESEVAEQYIVNSLFIITIPKIQKDIHRNYALIKQKSQYFVQNQVLFRPLESFLIKKVQKKTINNKPNTWTIQMEHKNTDIISKKLINNQPIEEFDRKFINLIIIQRNLLNQMACQGDVLIRNHQYLQGGLQYYQFCLSIAQDWKSKNSAMQILAMIASTKDQPSKAISYLKQCQRKYLQINDHDMEEQLVFSTILNNLANAYSSEGKFQECSDLYDRSVKLQVKWLKVMLKEPKKYSFNLKNYLRNLMKTYVNLGQFYSNFAKGEISLKYFQHAKKMVDFLQFSHQSNFIAALIAINQAKNNSKFQLNPKKIWEDLQESQKFILNFYGQNHPFYVQCLYAQADLLVKQQKYDKAQKLYEKCLKIQASNTSPDNYKCGIILNSIADIYSQKNQPEKALKFYKKSLQIIQNDLGKNHFLYGNAIRTLGNFFFNHGIFVKALSFYDQACKILASCMGERNIHFIQVLKMKGETFRKIQDFEQAEKILEQCVELQRTVIGVDSKDIISVLSVLAQVYDQSGQKAKALNYYSYLSELEAKNLGKQSIQYARTLNNIGIILIQQRKFHKALQTFKKSYKIFSVLLPSQHSQLSFIRHNIKQVKMEIREQDLNKNWKDFQKFCEIDFRAFE